MRLKPEFDKYSVFILDCDGVLWRGERVIEGAPQAVKALVELGKTVVYATNNSTRSRKVYARRLGRMGFPAEENMVFSSSYITARYLEGRVSTAFVIGEEGLVEELLARGIEIAPLDPDERVDSVVVGLDRGLTYGKLALALSHLEKEALFVATNRDVTLPSSTGLLPGAGAIVAALETASGRKVDVEAGKPSPIFFETVLRDKNVDPSEALVIGDRLDTDIEGAEKAGLDSALVFTGVARPGDVGAAKPTFTLNNLLDLFSA